jgi:hypothetical protein
MSESMATRASILLTKEQREQVYKLLDDIADEKLPIDDYTELASHYVLLASQVARLSEQLKAVTFALNSARLIMADKDTRDLALEIVSNARAILKEIEEEKP